VKEEFPKWADQFINTNNPEAITTQGGRILTKCLEAI
jgi:hypothetical protein